ncbi:MAG: endolytic transglycosylase MltG [Bdellovibrionia bacterium]
MAKGRGFRFGFYLSVLFLLGAVVFFGKAAVFYFSPQDEDLHTPQIVEIRKGQTPREISKLLVDLGLVSDSSWFFLTGRLAGQWRRVKSGEYRLAADLSPREIFSVLTSGNSLPHPFTVREGENRYEIAAELEQKGLGHRQKFLDLSVDPQFIRSFSWFQQDPPATLEGYFFPDTYYLNTSLSEEDLIRLMVKHFFQGWTSDYDQRSQEVGLNRHQVVTLASMIEKETGAEEERPLISSVFHNRLKKHMKLQSDPTTIYGMWERYHGKLSRKDLSEKNLYNTYFVSGLPVGPIGNPGQLAIRAALYPADSSYLYFVSHNDGTHQFSRTLQEHNRAVHIFQLDPKMRVGKSWRDHLRQKAGPASLGSESSVH